MIYGVLFNNLVTYAMVRCNKKGENLKPRLSYTIWFTQRTGSTLLSRALELTGVAGIPNEWLNNAGEQDLVEFYDFSNPSDLQEHLWEIGSTSNGIFGVKVSYYEPFISRVLATFRRFPGCPQVKYPRPEIWHHAFPNCRHIYMTRRNKVRLAVSWWKAAQTQEWHREKDATPNSENKKVEYHYDAINHLYNESSMREAGIQEFFSEAGIVPLSIFYEDLIQEYETTVKRVLAYIDLESEKIEIPAPYYEKLADEVSDEWVQRFREERQKEWPNIGW
nr:Trehalose 2-sulfotransferase [Chloroflexota bacterium]